jgi:hypothetical protein
MHECKSRKENYRCVNCINYNKYQKTTQVNENAEVIKVNSERRYYTRHGQHMNVTGKELVAKNIIETI